MTPLQKRERTLRVRRMNRILKKLFPESTIHLKHSSPWELLVAVILSAQCTDARVNEVSKELFAKYQTIEAYARAPQRELERLIYRCGFFRMKAQNIRAAAQKVCTDFHGVVPRTMRELMSLPGVGRKTANVVLSTAFGIHEGIAVDTHVRRFAIRFDLTDYTEPEGIERDLIELMPKKYWWSFNHRLVEYGRSYCPARRHECSEHPLTRLFPKAAATWPRGR